MTSQEVTDTVLSWCGGIGPTFATVEEIEKQRLQFQGKKVLEGNELDLDILLSLYLSPPKLRWHDKEMVAQFQGYVLEWIETWVLLSPDITVSAIIQRAKKSPSAWLPFLEMVRYLGQTEGRKWIAAIVLFARVDERLMAEIDSTESRAIAEILNHESQEWHDVSKEWDRQLRSGMRSYSDS